MFSFYCNDDTNDFKFEKSVNKYVMTIQIKRKSYMTNRISGEMVSVLASSVVERGFEHRSGQTKDYKIGIQYFSVTHTALRRTSTDWLAWNQDNVSEWVDMFILGLLFQ